MSLQLDRFIPHGIWENFMQNVKVNTGVSRIPLGGFYLAGFVLVILVASGLVLSNLRKPPVSVPVLNTITESTLEEKFGLQVKLIAVTGAGGFVDVRIKIVDGEKAKLLLADAENFPTIVTENGATLNAPADTKSQKIEFISGGYLFILYPNSGNAVTQGVPVTISFGDITLVPITAR